MSLPGHWPLAIGYWPVNCVSRDLSLEILKLQGINRRASMKDFRQLEVWNRAERLVVVVYRASREFPQDERYGLTSQLRRAAVSITANIAEGCGRNSDKEFARFLEYARGSAAEVESHLAVSSRLGFIPPASSLPLSEETKRIQRMLSSLIRKTRSGDRWGNR